MIRRPKPGEGEEDILRMQDEFMKEKSKNDLQPAAQVVNLRRTQHLTTKRSNASSSETRKPSKYAQSKGLETYSEKRPRVESASSNIIGDILEKNTEEAAKAVDDDKVYFPKVLPSVLGKIVEKNIDVSFDFNIKPMPSKGFPSVTKRDSALPIKCSQTQPCDIRNKERNSDAMDLDESCSSEYKKPDLNCPSDVLSSTKRLANEIHNENVKLLSKMSKSEILEERNKLLSALDPRIVTFLKNKKKISTQSSDKDMAFKKVNETASIDMTESETDNTVEMEDNSTKTNVDNSFWDTDILSDPNIHKWLHFDNLEKDKLEWIKDINESKVNIDEPYEARFDFNGYLLPYTVEYNEKTKPLFHHGEESHRPGYSLNELIELSRSTVTQQRVMALNAIAGILEYSKAGTYKNIIEIPLSKLFFVVRISMDENKVIILEPALKAMRNLLYNKIDEASLDALVGLREGSIQPGLENDKSEIQEIDAKESELKDFHLAEIDIIAAIQRTDILQRLYYILDKIKPPFNCVQYALQILIRLARDSLEYIGKIVQTDHLMIAILKYFVPSTSINFMFDPSIVYNGKPILAALKLLRILSLTSKEISELLIVKYDILTPISEYIRSGLDGSYGLKLQLEAISILANLLKFNLGIEDAKALWPVIITTLYKHVHGTNIFINTTVLSATHAAVVLQLINNFIIHDIAMDYKTQLYPLLKEGLEKWISQLCKLDTYTCGHLRPVCAIFNCLETVIRKEQLPATTLNSTLAKFSQSRGFLNLIGNLSPCSNLLSGINDANLHLMKNLVTLETSVIDSDGKVLPVLSNISPIPVLGSLFSLLCVLNDKDVSELFLEPTIPYLQKFAERGPSLINNWFTGMEIDLIFSLVRLAALSDVPESSKDLVYAVANKLCYMIRKDRGQQIEFLFNDVIFNKQWFTADTLFHLVSLSEAGGSSKVLTNIDEIKRCYSMFINQKYMNTGPFIIYKTWQDPILPRDWIYLPILLLFVKNIKMPTPGVFNKCAAKTIQEKDMGKENIISCCLEWILLNELCFPDLLKDINETNRFCHLMCVFLCDNSLFLDAKIKPLLLKCTQLLFKKGKKKFDFDKDMEVLRNFQDFYTKVLEQFQSVSYGDHTFAACVLVPLAQMHNVKWRKLVWSEYAGCLRALDCPESLLCYSFEEYLYPEETDESLLKSYHRALTTNLLRPGTVSYKIANHHVECYKKRKSVNNTQ